MSPPPAVLARYGPAVAGLRWTPLGPGAGFSGAAVWRGEDESGHPHFALKSWPPATTAARLAQIHARMRQAAHLPFVPAVLPTTAGSTVVVVAGRVWDVCRWLPGGPADSVPPTEARLRAGCAAVARLHAAFPPVPPPVPCPAALNRLRVYDEFRTAFSQRDYSAFGPLVVRARDLAARAIPAVEPELLRLSKVPVRARPCVRDLRAAHVLFTGDVVTGIVDYGAMANDHPAADLARLLGEVVGDDDPLLAVGVAAYRAAGGEAEVTVELVRLLDRTGVVGSVVGWLRRLTSTKQSPATLSAVTSRLMKLTARLEK